MSIEFLFYTFRSRTKRSSCLDDALSKKFFNKQKQDLSSTLISSSCKYFLHKNMKRHYKIFCVNRNTGFRKESRIFYFIHLQNEEDYERKESSSA